VSSGIVRLGVQDISQNKNRAIFFQTDVASG